MQQLTARCMPMTQIALITDRDEHIFGDSRAVWPPLHIESGVRLVLDGIVYSQLQLAWVQSERLLLRVRIVDADGAVAAALG